MRVHEILIIFFVESNRNVKGNNVRIVNICDKIDEFETAQSRNNLWYLFSYLTQRSIARSLYKIELIEK